MRRWLAVAVVALMVAVPMASGATWERFGYDPGRTGAIPFEGPQTNDTAFEVQLPGTPVRDTLLVDGWAYLVTIDSSEIYDGDAEGLNTQALWRVELATGEVEKVLDIPDGTHHEALMPGLLVLEDGEDLVAFELPSGDERWRARVLPSPAFEDRLYQAGVVQGDRFYAPFHAELEQGSADPRLRGVMATDLETGEVLWTWNRTTQARQDSSLPGPVPQTDPSNLYPRVFFMTLSADAERVYTYMQALKGQSLAVEDQRASGWVRQVEVWGLDAQTGMDLWSRNDTARETVSSPEGTIGEAPGNICCAPPTVTTSSLYTRLDAFLALNPATGEVIWPSSAGGADQRDLQGATGMGARGDVVIGTTEQTVYRLDPVTGDLVWQSTDPTPEKTYMTDPVVLDGTTAYVSTLDATCEFTEPGMEAWDPETGELQWSWRYTPSVGFQGESCTFARPNKPAFGPGVMVHGAKDGTVNVVGQTEASLGAPEVDEERYPEAGEAVELDLADTGPGAFGEATRYMVDWGDGTVTGWQEDPVLTHTYEDEETYQARAIAGNDANQTSSTFVTMNVGQPAPNWLSERFEPENQEMTFGVIGIALALGGGVIGVGRRYRKRSRLQDELDALERGFEETRDQPSECEALLDNRKARARSLALDGKLEEDQVSIVENRAEELRAELRVDALEDRFGFLPYSLVTKARQMVEDGTVTALERDAFLQALEDDEVLTSQQKATVRERIEQWFARDAGGSGSR